MKTIGVVLVMMMAACTADTGGVAVGDDDPAAPDASVTGGDVDARPGVDPAPDARPSTGAGAPGSACSCDADCAADGGHDGVCIFGVCMTEASADCASGGSQAECPAGSRCWGLTGHDADLCWPDCDAHTCSGTCDADGSCVPAADDDCDATCGAACSCTETSCGDGMACVGGECVADVDVGPGPGAGPGPSCTLPTRDCVGTTCDDLVVFDPRTTTAWDDYPINGETAANQYRSYLRRDLKMLLEHVTAKVLCKTAAWDTGNGGALGLGDMSEANGAIPGTSIGSPGHPAGTHLNGPDIDLGYYQLGTADNKLRPICPHTTASGEDAYHCTGAPTTLDVWRHAMFLGALFESSRVRVIGVDGQAGPLLIAALDKLCDDGWLSASACGDVALAYETTDEGLGWFHFHHHHTHISLSATAALTIPSGCAEPGCEARVKSLPGREAGVHRVR